MLTSNLIRISPLNKSAAIKVVFEDGKRLLKPVNYEKNQNKKEVKTSLNESNFSEYIKLYRKLLLLNERNNLATTLKNIQELLTFSEKIFSSSAVSEAFLYFCLHGASTAWILQNELNIAEATVYRALKRLRSLNIVVPALKIAKIKNSKGGPRPTVWALKDSSKREISNALKLHYRLLSPKYRVAEEVAQTILDDYMMRKNVNEISYKDIIIQVKELGIPFRTPDIADLAASYLHEKGIKVWR
jgi:predicted transcriptional regulator